MYKFKVHRDEDRPEKVHGITAYHNGKEVGSATLDHKATHIDDASEISIGKVYVHPKHRRKGVATNMYKLLERHTNKKLVPSEDTSDSADALWNQPNRPFGKSEGYNRRNPFNKQEEEETELKKMSRGLPEFKNLPKVTSRPDQEIQNIDTDRQSKMFAQKVANDSRFPQQSIRSDIEDQIRQATKRPKPEYLSTSRQAAKDRWDYDISDDELTSSGLVVGGTSQKRPLGMVRDEGKIPTARRREHEAIHLSLDQIGKQYGHKMQEYAQKKMNDLIHPSVSGHLSQHLGQIGYGPHSHPKELVTHLYEMLHDPKTRNLMRHTNPEFKNNEREIMHHAKKSWNAIRDFASKLKAGDEQ